MYNNCPKTMRPELPEQFRPKVVVTNKKNIDFGLHTRPKPPPEKDSLYYCTRTTTSSLHRMHLFLHCLCTVQYSIA
jgi:hypothetical protein